MHREVSIDGGNPCRVNVTHGQRRCRVWLDSRPHDTGLKRSGHDWTIEVDGVSEEMTIVADKERVLIHAFGRTWRVTVVDPVERALGSGEGSDVAKAPMPGVAISVMVKTGDEIVDGQPLVIMESMKMQTWICASRAGTVDQVNVRVGETFPLGAPLVTLVPLIVEP